MTDVVTGLRQGVESGSFALLYADTMSMPSIGNII
jgi:hypothetical protein